GASRSRARRALELRLPAALHPARRPVLRLAVFAPAPPVRAAGSAGRRSSPLRSPGGSQCRTVSPVPPARSDRETDLRAALGELDAVLADPQRLQSAKCAVVLLQLRRIPAHAFRSEYVPDPPCRRGGDVVLRRGWKSGAPTSPQREMNSGKGTCLSSTRTVRRRPAPASRYSIPSFARKRWGPMVDSFRYPIQLR